MQSSGRPANAPPRRRPHFRPSARPRPHGTGSAGGCGVGQRLGSGAAPSNGDPSCRAGRRYRWCPSRSGRPQRAVSSHGCSPPTADGSGEPNEQSTGEFRPSSSTTVNPGIGTPAALAAATLTTAVGVTAAGELCSAADCSAADCSAAADSPRLLRTLLLQPQDRLPGSPRPRVLRRQACSCSCRQGRPGLPSCMRWVPSRLPPQPARKNPDALTHLTDSGCGNLDNVPLANDWPSAFCLIVDFGPRVTK